jgi:hypothetical protein
MLKKSNIIILATLLFLHIGTTCFAREVTLAWDENPETNIAGYKIYYKTGTSSLPFNGWEASEGTSPIDVGDVTTATLTDLDDYEVYYFAVTAYDTAGYESGYSNIVATHWLPTLYYPEDGASDVLVSYMFEWSEPPEGNYTYTLYYGTDPDLQPGSLTAAGDDNRTLAAAAFLCFMGFSAIPRKKTKKALALGILGAGLLLSSCGGGGGGGDSALSDSDFVDSSHSCNDAESEKFTNVVADITDNYYEEYDLQPSTTYYWKVVAYDEDEQVETESTTYSFTTE